MNKIKKFIKSENGFKLIFLFLFFLLNFLNMYVINSKIYIRDMFVLPKTFLSFLSCTLGDLGFLILTFGVGLLIFKSDIKLGKYLIVITSIISLLMLGLSLYYSYYKAFPSIWNLKSFSGESGGDAFKFLLDSFIVLLKKSQFLFLLPILFLVVIWYIIPNKKIKKNPTIKGHQIIGEVKRVYLGLFALVFGIASMLTSTIIYNSKSREKGYEDLKLVAEGVQTIGVVNYYLYEVCDYVFFKDQAPTDDKIQKTIDQLKEYLNTNERKSENNQEYKGIFEGKNLLMIQIESMNNFLIGLNIDINGTKKEITPNLNKLVLDKSSAYFNNYYTNVGIGNTSDSEFTIMTGIYPTGYSYTVYEYIDDSDYETIAKLFNEKDYYTYSSHANIGTFYLRSDLHPNLYGFKEHIDERKLIEAEVYDEERLVHTWVNDVDFLKYNIDYMKQKQEETNKPIFNFAITISCHMPYEMYFDGEEHLDDTSKNMFLEKERLFPLGYDKLDEQHMAYLEHASYTDYALGKAIERLEEVGLLEDTVLVLYGDHGCGIDIYESFYENKDLFTNDINEIITDGYYNQDLIERRMLLEVPFIIYDGAKEVEFKEEAYSMVRGHNSVSRTISNLFNLDNKYSFGVDLFSEEKTFIYNPRNMDIVLDDVSISAISLDVHYYDNSKIMTSSEIRSKVDNVLKYKDFNDKILKYGLFKK